MCATYFLKFDCMYIPDMLCLNSSMALKLKKIQRNLVHFKLFKFIKPILAHVKHRLKILIQFINEKKVMHILF